MFFEVGILIRQDNPFFIWLRGIMTDTSKVTRIKVENTCVKDNTGKKGALYLRSNLGMGVAVFSPKSFV